MNPADFNQVQRASRILSLETLIKQNEELMRCLVETQSRLRSRLDRVVASRKSSERGLASFPDTDLGREKAEARKL